MEKTKGFFISFESEASKIRPNIVKGRMGVFYSIEDIYPLLDKIGKFPLCVVEIEVPSASVKKMPGNSKKFYFCGSKTTVRLKNIYKLKDIVSQLKLESIS